MVIRELCKLRAEALTSPPQPPPFLLHCLSWQDPALLGAVRPCGPATCGICVRAQVWVTWESVPGRNHVASRSVAG